MPPVEQQAGGLAQLAVSAIASTKSKRLQWALSAYTVGTVGYQQGRKLWTRYQERNQFTVSVPGDDEVYDELHGWLLERMPEKDRRSVVARSESAGRIRDEVAPVDGRWVPSRVRLFYDSSAHQSVVIGGHSVRVHVDKPEWANRLGQSSGEWLQQMAKQEEKMVFTCENERAHTAVLAFLAELVAAHEETRKPRLRLAGRWGGWNHRNDLPLRALDTVVLREGQRDMLAADVVQFLASEDAYNRMGVPWHRGYLFHGPPGTGKTSLARAIATEFNLDVWYIPLTDLDQDTKLLGLIAEVGAGSMLLLEDIDTLRAATDRNATGVDVAEEAPFGISAGGLFNSLDGVATPHGLITVMTTNHIDRLDPALTRPGRVDRQVHIDYLDSQQFLELVRTFLHVDFDLDMEAWGAHDAMTAADVVDVLKVHVDDPEGAVLALKELVG